MTMEMRLPALRTLRAGLGLSQESLSRALDVSARSVERWEAGAKTENAETIRRIAVLSEIADLVREVYGDEPAAFMSTPRKSLSGHTPREALLRGDLDLVLGVLARALNGEWA